MKKTLSLLLALVMAATMLAACNSGNPGGSTTAPPSTTAPATSGGGSTTAPATTTEAAYVPNGSFTSYMTGDIDTINPHIYTLSNSGDVITMSLMRLYVALPTADGKAFTLEGEFADGDPIKMDEEGKIWQIKLRENAVWATGEKITVDDLIYSWQMCLDPILVNSRASQLASDYITIVNAKEYYLQGDSNSVSWDDVGIKKIDDYTLGLELTDPVTADDIKSHTNYTWTVVVYKPSYEAGMDAGRTKTTYGSSTDGWVSCGRWILKDWINGSQINFDRNPDYVMAETTKLANYSFKMLQDSNTALELFLNGEIDVVNLNASVIEQYIDDPRVVSAPASAFQAITINHGNTNNNGILGNLNFRKALYYAIDRVSISGMTNGIPANYYVPQKCLGDTTRGLSFRNMPEAQAYLPANNGYDPVLAKQHFDLAMEECGLTTLTLQLNYNEASSYNKAVSEFLEQQLPIIFGDSFTLTLFAGPSSVLNTYLAGWKNGDPNSFELGWYGWNTSTTAPWNGLKVYSSMYSNKCEPFYNDELDAIWEEANYSLEAKLDPWYRLELTMQMEQICIDQVPVVPIYESPGYYMISERIELPSDGYIPGYGFGYALSSVKQ